jgi:Zn-dependent protease
MFGYSGTPRRPYRGSIIDRLRDYQQRIGPVATGVLVIILAVLIYGLVDAIRNSDISHTIAIVLGRLIGLLIGFTLHEWAHAYTAVRIGGYSALPDHSRLSFDPRVHIDPFGFVLALVVGYGWARPVPVNPSAFYPNERREMLTVSFAGPFMNLCIALVVAIILRFMLVGGILEEIIPNYVVGSNDVFNFVYQVVGTVVYFNLLQFLFNLLPFSPLDGWRVLLGLLPPEQATEMEKYTQTSFIILMMLIVLGLVTPNLSPIFVVLNPLLNGLYELFTGFVYSI